VISVHLPIIQELLQYGETDNQSMHLNNPNSKFSPGAYCNKVDKKGMTPLDVTKSIEVQQFILGIVSYLIY